MGHFGQELRKERESRGIALETITSVTKISGRHLLSLEEGKFDALPGGVLTKGIVRGYARVVGLDEEDCLRRYLADYERSGFRKEDDSGWVEFAANVGRNRKGEYGVRTRLQWAGVAVLLTLLAVFGWYVAQYVQGRVSFEFPLPRVLSQLPEVPGRLSSVLLRDRSQLSPAPVAASQLTARLPHPQPER